MELQKKVQAAVISGKGGKASRRRSRKQADTPWFRSLLQFDPAKVMPKVKQPILIIQGDLDTQVAPQHAEKLAELARARKKRRPVEGDAPPGINHLLVPATTGRSSEYAVLQDNTITRRVAKAIVDVAEKVASAIPGSLAIC